MNLSKRLHEKPIVPFDKKEARKDLKAFSWLQRLKSKVSGKPLKFKLNNQQLASWVILQKGKENFIEHMAQLNSIGIQFNRDLHNTFSELVKQDYERAPESDPQTQQKQAKDTWKGKLKRSGRKVKNRSSQK